MTTSGIIALAVGLMMGICVFGTASAQGKTATQAMESMARQPEAAKSIQSSLILSLGLMEALTIYGLLIAFMLVAKI